MPPPISMVHTIVYRISYIYSPANWRGSLCRKWAQVIHMFRYASATLTCRVACLSYNNTQLWPKALSQTEAEAAADADADA